MVHVWPARLLNNPHHQLEQVECSAALRGHSPTFFFCSLALLLFLQLLPKWTLKNLLFSVCVKVKLELTAISEDTKVELTVDGRMSSMQQNALRAKRLIDMLLALS